MELMAVLIKMPIPMLKTPRYVPAPAGVVRLVWVSFVLIVDVVAPGWRIWEYEARWKVG